MAPHMYYMCSAISAQGRIQGGVKIDHGGPFFKKNFFFRPEGYSKKKQTNAYQWYRSMWEEMLFLVPFRIFTRFLRLFGRKFTKLGRDEELMAAHMG